MQDNVKAARPLALDTNVICLFCVNVKRRIDLTHHLSSLAQIESGGVRTHQHPHISLKLTLVAIKGHDM